MVPGVAPVEGGVSHLPHEYPLDHEMNTPIEDVWSEWAKSRELPDVQYFSMYGFAFGILALMWVFLRFVFRPKSADEKSKVLKDGEKRLIQEGEASESQMVPYTTDWKSTFDFWFFISMVLFFPIMYFITYLTMPEILSSPAVWMNFLIKFGVMVVASVLGGIIARCCAEIDERGYIKTGPDSKTVVKLTGFKVNYTRKIQHFSAYAVPLLMTSPIPKGALELAWSDWCTLMGFVILIKPIREWSSFFMMQFNALDRPEDRPHTLKWIVLGDIVPGMLVIIVMNAILSNYIVNGYNAAGLAFIFVMVTGLGDGFAEPVGVHWGKHRYEVGAIMGGGHRKYSRSFEGSCCVAFSALIFTPCCWYMFPNATSFWATMIVLPPAMAWSEARAPHTMDTPFLFLVGGILLWLSLYIPPVLDHILCFE